MATLQWSNLPADILSKIGKLITSDVDILRFRSVCSSWRSSLPRPQNPISFPLKLPLLRNPPNLPHYPGSSGYCTLHQSTVYRLSPPSTGLHASDPSYGWLLKVSETNPNPNPNPNAFSLRDLLTAEKLSVPPRTIPTQLNLLEYRISELGKSYYLDFPDESNQMLTVSLKKVIGLTDYVSGCKFAALILRLDGSMIYWKFGDDHWTPIDTKGYEIQDVNMCNGICYAVDITSALVSFDSDLKLKVVAPPRNGYRLVVENFMVEFESDLYMVSRVCSPELECRFGQLEIQPGERNATAVIFGLKLSRLNKGVGKWRNVKDLGDRVLVVGVDAPFGVYARDFKGCKGNRIYMNDFYFAGASENNDIRGVYHLDEQKAFIFAKAEDVGKIFYPGRWL